MFDLFAARYGYTLNEFYSLTMRQVHAIKRTIEKNKTKESEFQAGLHGKKIQGAIKPIITSPERQQEQDQQRLSLMERMRKRHQDGQRSRVINKDQRDS